MPAPLRSLVPCLAGVLSASLLLAACGSSTTEEPSTAVSGGADDVFPVTVEHEFGETVVAAEPERIVTVGVTEQDIVLELGFVPVGITEWYGEQPSATWPWAQDLLGGAEPEVLTTSDGFDYESIAALRPDLIVGTNAGMTEQDYDKLSKIAPTITSMPDAEAYFSPWQDQTIQIATALGKQEEGERIVDEIEDLYAETAAAHPEFQGLQATFSQGAPYDGILYVYPDGLSTDFLTDLGFTMTPGLEEFAPVDSQAEISAENVELIDADVIVFATESAEMFDELQGWSTISNLGAVKEGRAVYTDEILAGAIYFVTPLAQRYLLERLPDMLAAAVEGEAPQEYVG